jgi:hypothetical protein
MIHVHKVTKNYKNPQNFTYQAKIKLTLKNFQLLTPFVFIILPVAACLIAAFFGYYSPQLAGQIGFILITLYGLANSIFTVIFVGPFRKHARNNLVRPVIRPVCKLLRAGPKWARSEVYGAGISSITAPSSTNNTSSLGPRRTTRAGSLYATPVNRLI